MSACLFICLFTYKLHGCLWSMCMFVNLFSLPFLILVLEPEDTEEPVLREHVEVHSTARVGFWHTRTSPRTAAPILTKMKHTQTGNQGEQICCGLPPMNLGIHSVWNTPTSKVQSCTPTILATFPI